MDLEPTLREIAPAVLRYCRARLGDPALAEEVAQDALTALVERWRRQGPPDSAEAFVLAVARRRAARASWRRRFWTSLDVRAGDRDPAADPETEALGRDELDRLRRIAGKLAAGDREALLLSLSGVNATVAAKSLGITPEAVRARLFRARRRLRAELENGNGR